MRRVYADRPAPGLSVEELLAAKGTQSLASVGDLAADTFSSDVASLSHKGRLPDPLATRLIGRE